MGTEFDIPGQGRAPSRALEIVTDHRADVHVIGWDRSASAWRVVRALDRHGIRAIVDVADERPDSRRMARLTRECSALVVFGGGSGSDADGLIAAAVSAGVPVASVGPGEDVIPGATWFDLRDIEDDNAAWRAFASQAVLRHPAVTPYAFFIGRLERDFTQARAAIRTAVEAEAGMTCVWADDGRHRTGSVSVREQTHELIRHAAVVIADLTLGKENTEHTNPSRAHEIGMALAYERPVVLCSQEPRRVPYYSISDLQMAFWADESELAALIRRRLRADRADLGRTVLNHALPNEGGGPHVAAPVFRYDPSARYVGPRTPQDVR